MTSESSIIVASNSITLPPAIRLGASEVVAVDEVADDFLTIIREAGSLYEWAADQTQPVALRGRAPVYVALLPKSSVEVVVRHAWHGGLLAPITGDRFIRPSRAPFEMAISSAMRSAGIATTEILGFVRYDAGMGLVRVDVASRFVSNASDLGTVLGGLAPDIGCDEALEATLHLLNALSVHGISHPDLNVKNILLHRPHEDTLRAMVIDVDVIKWDASRGRMATAELNVRRLSRSMRKWRRHFDCDLPDDSIDKFVRRALDDAGSVDSAEYCRRIANHNESRRSTDK